MGEGGHSVSFNTTVGGGALGVKPAFMPVLSGMTQCPYVTVVMWHLACGSICPLKVDLNEF